MYNLYPDTFFPVEYHTSGSYYVSYVASRRNFYAITGVPTTCFDGVIRRVGGSAGMSYVANYNARQAVATDVTVDVQAVRVGNNEIYIKGEIGIEAGGVAKDLRIYTMQVIDKFPVSPSYARNTFRAALPTVDIHLEPGQTYEVTHYLTVDAYSVSYFDSVKVGMWAQAPFASYPAEIYNCGVENGPIDFLVGDLNCDGEIDFGDINPFVLALTDPAGWQAAYPDCDYGNADIDGSGVVDFGDINPFVRLLTQP